MNKERILCIALLEVPQYIPPLGIAYINGALVDAGYDSDLLVEFVQSDCTDKKLHIDEGKFDHKKLKTLVSVIEEYAPTSICYTISNTNCTSTLACAEIIRSQFPEVRQILGGPEVRYLLTFKERLPQLNRIFDYIVESEGEKVIIDIFRQISSKQNEEIPGAFSPPYQQGENEKRIQKEFLVKELDALPIPNFGSLPRLKRFHDDAGWSPGIPINLSRGCTGSCSFCNVRNYSGPYRCRSAESVYNEILTQSRHYKTNQFIIVDDDPLSMKEFPELVEKLISAPLAFNWHIYNAKLSPKLIDPKLIKNLKASGLSSLVFGLESASDNVRKHMNKKFEVSKCTTILDFFKQEGIECDVNLIYCYPTETDEDFDITLQWIKQNGHLLRGISANVFVKNHIFLRRYPNLIDEIEPHVDEPLVSWENSLVNREVMWKRHKELLTTLDNCFLGSFNLASPTGKFTHRSAIK